MNRRHSTSRSRIPGLRSVWRVHPVLTALIVLLAASMSCAACLPPRFIVLNLSQSIEPGFYVRTKCPPARGALVEFHLPQEFRDRCDEEAAYCRSDVPILKPIAAEPGDHVSTIGGWLWINGERVAPILTHDSKGHPLPVWRARRVLKNDEFFVFSRRVPNSMDSRYFGPVRRSAILVRRPLLTWSGQE